MLFWTVIFFTSLILLFHSYLFYPLLVTILSGGKKQNDIIYSEDDTELPTISILLAAYNEEVVITEKIKSIYNTTYPLSKIEMIIGSDASTDGTNNIVSSFMEQYPGLRLVNFPGRTGKAGIINKLAKQAKNDILILTDANVMFQPQSLYHLVKHYRNKDICLVGGNIVNSRFNSEGISIAEETYISRENRIKYQEGILWGAMAGAFGGCYSIRSGWYAEVPPRFFMDDFYITMNVLEKGGKAINELQALCFEDVSNKISEEFRRKVRISIGNFQNLCRYWKLMFPLFSGLSFSFISHKILRWFGPFFLIFILVSNIFLFPYSLFFQISMGLIILFTLIPLVDTLLRKLKVNINLLRLISHFYFMNAALLLGFFKFLKGVKSNIWQPTQRFQ